MVEGYGAAKPVQFGRLHERMKYLLLVAGRDELWRTHNDVWQAIHDLQVEVRNYEQDPGPPFGRRPITRG